MRIFKKRELVYETLLNPRPTGFDRMTTRKFTSRTKWNKKEIREKIDYEKLIKE